MKTISKTRLRKHEKLSLAQRLFCSGSPWGWARSPKEGFPSQPQSLIPGAPSPAFPTRKVALFRQLETSQRRRGCSSRDDDEFKPSLR
jgi:hypothetical protein